MLSTAFMMRNNWIFWTVVAGCGAFSRALATESVQEAAPSSISAVSLFYCKSVWPVRGLRWSMFSHKSTETRRLLRKRPTATPRYDKIPGCEGICGQPNIAWKVMVIMEVYIHGILPILWVLFDLGWKHFCPYNLHWPKYIWKHFCLCMWLSYNWGRPLQVSICGGIETTVCFSAQNPEYPNIWEGIKPDERCVYMFSACSAQWISQIYVIQPNITT